MRRRRKKLTDRPPRAAAFLGFHPSDLNTKLADLQQRIDLLDKTIRHERLAFIELFRQKQDHLEWLQEMLRSELEKEAQWIQSRKEL